MLLNKSQSDTTDCSTGLALTTEQVRGIVADHAELFGALVDAAPKWPMSFDEWAIVGARVLIGEPSILSSIVACRDDQDQESAATLGPFKGMLLALPVINATRAAYDEGTLRSLIAAEVAPYSSILNGARQ